MTAELDKGRAVSGGMALIGCFVAAKLLVHLIYNPYFGYHQDEFYFIACGEHLSFGYVDHAPFVPWTAWLSQRLFGQSLAGLRFFPAVAGAVSILLTGLLVRRLGGGRFAQGLACLAVFVAPVYLRSGNMLCIPAFEPMYWLLGAYCIVRLIQDENPKWWLAIGVAAGLGLMNKHSMLFFGFGLAVAIVATPLRKYLRTPWPYAGGLIAGLIFLPNIAWQIANGWPTLEFMRELNANVMSRISTAEFLIGQILYEHPVNAPIWIAGLVSVLVGTAKKYRALGIIYLSVLGLLLVTKGKIYYLAPAYPMLFAAGAVAIGRFAEKGRTWLKPVTLGAVAAGGLLFAPLSLPMLDIERTDRYIKAVTLGLIKNAYELTGDLHAQFGWEQIVQLTVQAYRDLPEDERERCVVVAPNYSVAGALDYFGRQYGLPPAVSGHMTYYLWGYPPEPHSVYLVAMFSEESLRNVFEEVEITATFYDPLVNPWMNGRPIAICRKPKIPMAELWPRLRDYS